MTASTSFAAAKPQNDNVVKVFVHFADTPGKSEWGLIRAFGGTVTNSYSIIPAVAAEIPESAILGLSHNPSVTVIKEDHKMKSVLSNISTKESDNMLVESKMTINL